MDDIDRATAHAASMLDAQLAHQIGKSQGQGKSARTCEACGATIPQARRQAIPGVRLCAPCKGRQEQPPHSKSRT